MCIRRLHLKLRVVYILVTWHTQRYSVIYTGIKLAMWQSWSHNKEFSTFVCKSWRFKKIGFKTELLNLMLFLLGIRCEHFRFVRQDGLAICVAFGGFRRSECVAQFRTQQRWVPIHNLLVRLLRRRSFLPQFGTKVQNCTQHKVSSHRVILVTQDVFWLSFPTMRIFSCPSFLQ